MRSSRRSFIANAAYAAWLLMLASSSQGQSGTSSRARLVLLGTGGGPRPRRLRSAPAQAVVVDGSIYVIDCGDGVARQMVRANLSLPSIRALFITHQHSDHNADYGNLLLLSWTAGLKTRVDTFGPPPIQMMTRLFLEMNAVDIETRITDEGRAPLGALIAAHDIAVPGLIFEDARVKVTAALVDHPPMKPAFAYRFDTSERSIVISGDTRYSSNLIGLAKGADLLVHEVMYPEAIGRMIRDVANASNLERSIRAHHTSAEDVGRVASAAGVGQLILSHFVPAEDPTVTDEMWLAAVRRHYSGPVAVGKDLDVF